MLSTQFALSLELTNLVPLAIEGIKWTYDKYLLRDLRNSGSDPGIEEDMVGLLGRARIDPGTRNAFKDIVGKTDPEKVYHLQENVILDSSPGPTLLRALKDPSGLLLSMIIQCSMLLCVHQRQSLATCLARALEKEIEEADGGHTGQDAHVVPAVGDIAQFLRTVHFQTSAYPWRVQIDSFAAQLEIEQSKIDEPLDQVIIRCMMKMGPLVQRFPEERIIHMRIGTGLCLLLVWIHNVMGLSVIIQGAMKSQESVIIGGEMPTVIIDYQPTRQSTLPSDLTAFETCQPYIALLERGDPDEKSLFNFIPEVNDDSLQATFRAPACGYAQRVLARGLPSRVGQDHLFRTFSQITCSLAIRLQERAFVDQITPSASTKDGEHGEPATLALKSRLIDYGRRRRCVIDATKLLWADDGLDIAAVEKRVASEEFQPFRFLDEAPSDIKAQSENWFEGMGSAEVKTLWHNLHWTARSLSIVILAFANIVNLDDARDLPICEEMNLLAMTELATDIGEWDGASQISWNFDTWFTIIIVLMRSSVNDIDLTGTALISENGWSVMYTTLNEDVDPACITRGTVVVRKGNPRRSGIWRYRVMDGLISGEENHSQYGVWGTTGDTIHLRMQPCVERMNAYCGQQDDAFVISLQTRMPYASEAQSKMLHWPPQMHEDRSDRLRISRTGFFDLTQSCALAMNTEQCQHPPKSNATLTLPDDCEAFTGFNMHVRYHAPKSSVPLSVQENAQKAKVCIMLTGGHTIVRWRALRAINSTGHVRNAGRRVVLRHNCCLQCAVKQRVEAPEKCFLIL